MENWNLTSQMIGLHDDQLLCKSTYACFVICKKFYRDPF